MLKVWNLLLVLSAFTGVAQSKLGEPTKTTDEIVQDSSTHMERHLCEDGKCKPLLSNVHIKLFWQQGYDWQGEHFERKWCLRCDTGHCNPGVKVLIHQCDLVNQVFDITPVSSNQDTGYLIKTASNVPNMCMERDPVTLNLIYMQVCDPTNHMQHWMAQNGTFDSARFQITQKDYTHYCVTDRHWPKDGEDVHMEPCWLAADSDTSYWTTY